MNIYWTPSIISESNRTLNLTLNERLHFPFPSSTTNKDIPIYATTFLSQKYPKFYSIFKYLRPRRFRPAGRNDNAYNNQKKKDPRRFLYRFSTMLLATHVVFTQCSSRLSSVVTLEVFSLPVHFNRRSFIPRPPHNLLSLNWKHAYEGLAESKGIRELEITVASCSAVISISNLPYLFFRTRLSIADLQHPDDSKRNLNWDKTFI
jgi:hypothetical protein